MNRRNSETAPLLGVQVHVNNVPAPVPERSLSAGPRLSNGYVPGFTPAIVSRSSSVDIRTMNDRITLTWKNIGAYVIPEDGKRCGNCCRQNVQSANAKQILKNVTGVASPGNLLAILGASGAGKTTLLNILNQRNIGKLCVEGTLCVNGVKVGDAGAIAAVSGYIQQDDLFVGTLTPAEHLWFQSMLRMDRHLSSEAREQRVEEVMKELGLNSCANTLIGSPPRIRGISGGERKRLAFASEVLTNPALLFCDEPTSGLDSFMAENVISSLKRLAAQGKTIVCTIHQPSSQVYALFDKVLLMAEGRVAYFGPTSQIYDFFSNLGSYCPSNFNPADFYIHQLAIVPSREDECRNFVQTVCNSYEKSPQCAEVLTELSVTEDPSHRDDVVIGNFKNRSPYKASCWRQFAVILWRSWLTNRRDPVLLRARIMQTLIVALLFGLIYLQQAYDQKGVMNINGSLFLLQAQMTFGTLFAVLNTFPLEFPVFMREHHNGMYRTGIYYVSKLLAEMPIFIIMPIVFSSITYWMIGLYYDLESFLIATAALLLVANVAVSFGYMVSCSTSNVTLALSIAPVILVPFMLFGGFFLNSGSVPVYFIWLQYISWFSYSNEIMVVNQWRHVTNITCELLHSSSVLEDSLSGLVSTSIPPPAPGPRCFPNGEAVISSLSYREDRMLLDFLVLIGLFVGFRAISYLLLLLRSRKRE